MTGDEPRSERVTKWHEVRSGLGRGAESGPLAAIVEAVRDRIARARSRGELATFWDLWCDAESRPVLRELGVTDANVNDVLEQLPEEEAFIICC